MVVEDINNSLVVINYFVNSIVDYVYELVDEVCDLNELVVFLNKIVN